MTTTRRRRRLTAPFIVACTAMLWLCTAIAAAAFWPIYESPEFLTMAVVAVAVSSMIAILGAVYRLQAQIVGLVAVGAYLILGVPLAVPDSTTGGVIPTLDGFRTLLAATSLSWKQLLTITLPVGSYEALLVPAFICILVSTTVSLSVGLRARQGEYAVIGPLALFVVALLFGPTTTFHPLLLSLGLSAASLLWIMTIRSFRRRAKLARSDADDEGLSVRKQDRVLGRIRSLFSAALILILAAGGAVGATALAPPTNDRSVLRSTISKPFDPRAYVSPLSGLRRYHQADAADEPMLTVEGVPEGGRIRIATLDSYNGIVYAVGGGSESFALVPSTFDQSAVSGTEISAQVTVDGYSGVWVPTVGALEAITFEGAAASKLRASFFYNDTSRTAAVTDELASGDRYRLRAILPTQPTQAELVSVTPGNAQVPAVGVTPDELSVALDRYTANISGEGARLMAAISGLKAQGYISHGVGVDEPLSRSGHSADRITELFAGQRMIGDEEQYSVAAAIMARELGFPARVVMGFVVPTTAAGASASDALTVRGGDISAWIEVNTAQYGWVTIDPTPPVRDIPPARPEDPAQVARPQAPVQPPPEPSAAPNDQTPPLSATTPVPTVDPFLEAVLVAVRVAGWGLAAIALVLSPFVAIIAAKVRRRTLRRRSSSPLERITGGWREFEDAVVDHGFAPQPSSTRAELASVVGGVQPLVLAAAADRASFAPQTPDGAEADLVWAAVDELRLSLDQGLTRRQRFQARVSLRSLDRRGAFARSRSSA